MSVIEAIFGKLDRAKKQKVAEGWPQYRQLLIDTSNDPDGVDPLEVESILEKQHKTREQFAADVGTMTDRLAWQKELERRPELTEREESLTRELTEAYERFEEAKQIYNAVASPKKLELRAAQVGLMTANSAETHLTRTSQDPSLKREMDALRAKSLEQSKKMKWLEYELNPKMGTAGGSRQRSTAYALGEMKTSIALQTSMGRDTTPFDRENFEKMKQQVTVVEQRLEGYQAELAKLKQSHALVAEKLDKLHRRKIEV